MNKKKNQSSPFHTHISFLPILHFTYSPSFFKQTLVQKESIFLQILYLMKCHTNLQSSRTYYFSIHSALQMTVIHKQENTVDPILFTQSWSHAEKTDDPILFIQSYGTPYVLVIQLG